MFSDGFNSDDHADEEDVTDDAWEQSGKFEGDLVLNKRQRRLIVEDVAEGLSRNGLQDITKRWPNNEVIYYIQKDHFCKYHLPFYKCKECNFNNTIYSQHITIAIPH